MDRTLTLYHGSSLILKRPQFGKGNPFHDYGLGFYCTETLEVAKEWACSMAQNGFVNRYSFRTDGLSILNLTDGNYTILNWLSILLMNRKFNLSSDIAAQGKEYLVSTFLPPCEDYDVIISQYVSTICSISSAGRAEWTVILLPPFTTNTKKRMFRSVFLGARYIGLLDRLLTPDRNLPLVDVEVRKCFTSSTGWMNPI